MVVDLVGTPYACGRWWACTAIDVSIVAGSALSLASGVLPQAAYSASKAGLIGLTRDLAVQWTGRKGIRVTAIAPPATFGRR
jgi:NAD(P)-dependent dehydrogenase (short-subunit alcohol dehydrogenase family)